MQKSSIYTGHLFKRIYLSKEPGLVFLKIIVFVILAVLLVLSVLLSIQPLFTSDVYRKDFLQEYLLGRAVIEGVHPYLPITTLTDRLIGEIPVLLMPHPTPHPPPVLFLGLPFGLLSYRFAAVAWFIYEVIVITISIWFLLSLFLKPRLYQVGLVLLAVLIWSPFKDELSVGQLMSTLMLLLIGAWFFLKSNQDVRGGLMIGAMLALKLTGWPIVLYLLLKKRWKAVIAAGAAMLLANLAAGLIIGLDVILMYYLKAGRQVAELYQNHERNFSLYAVGHRLLEGTYSPSNTGLHAPPLISLPAFSNAAAIGLVIVFVLWCLWLSFQMRDFELAFAVLICASLIVNPVAWSYYFILLSIPLVILFKRVRENHLPERLMRMIGLNIIFLLMSFGFRGFVFLIYRANPNQIEPVQISFAASLITLIPLFTVIWLIFTLAKLEAFHRQFPQPAPA